MSHLQTRARTQPTQLIEIRLASNMRKIKQKNMVTTMHRDFIHCSIDTSKAGQTKKTQSTGSSSCSCSCSTDWLLWLLQCKIQIDFVRVYYCKSQVTNNLSSWVTGSWRCEKWGENRNSSGKISILKLKDLMRGDITKLIKKTITDTLLYVFSNEIWMQKLDVRQVWKGKL